MSKNLQTDRILYNGKPGPFYLDVEDKTDGPDGTTKPVTKDILQEMIVANFPELQKVKDTELLNELQSVKQQQSQILERLNSPIDTRLTGSNVENAFPVKNLKETYSESKVMSITAGSTELIEEYPYPCELTALSIGTNDTATSIRIENRTNGSYDGGVRIVHPSGGSTNPVAPSVLRTIEGENDFWSEFVYDEERSRYAFGMKRVAIFSQGMRIRISGSRDADVALTYMVTRLEG